MAIKVKAYANADDVLIAWSPENWDAAWVGFELERRNDATGDITVIVNRIPAQSAGAPVADAGIPSDQSPIRRCLWTDHSIAETDKVSYRVTPMKTNGAQFTADTASRSSWTSTVVAKGNAGGGVAAYFNRGTLMSQIVSRFVHGNVTSASLATFANQLKTPGFPARRYLSGDARHQILKFLFDADRRGSEICAAIYEINDTELVGAFKPFGQRGNVLIGNGDATDPAVGPSLVKAGLTVHHRDLSRAGRSSPSVHNKFVVELPPMARRAARSQAPILQPRGFAPSSTTCSSSIDPNLPLAIVRNGRNSWMRAMTCPLNSLPRMPSPRWMTT
jgi:hypothetical protein